MISTRGRYALRVLIDLAENQDKGNIPMKDVAKRQDISLKYLEKILPVLTKNKYIEGIQGKGGGYKMIGEPKDYRVGDILRLTEGNLAPVACLEDGAKPCERVRDCRTISMWNKFENIINDYFDGITIADLMENNNLKDTCCFEI